MLIKSDSLESHKNQSKLKALLAQAELAMKTWQKLWTPFLSAPLREEILTLLDPINDLDCFSSGGYPGAERHRICFQRISPENNSDEKSVPIIGLNIEGNFLFDKANNKDFLFLLQDLGVEEDDIGDIWLLGDRGAQVICTPKTAEELNGKESSLREIKINFAKLEIKQLQIPAKRAPKRIKTVEASTRIDAIASAGFGLSRAKIVSRIKAGQLRLNWEPISTSTKSLKEGDLINLENKGSIRIINLEQTKKKRWRIELIRE